jgi:cytochrome c556
MENLMKKSLLAAGLAVALLSGEALAQAKPETLVKQRQSAMTLIGKYWGPMAGMMQGKIPYDVKVIQRNAGFLDNLSRMPWDGFAESTKDVKSAALPAIWSDNAKFRKPPTGCRTRLPSCSGQPQRRRGGSEGADRRGRQGLRRLPRELPPEAVAGCSA